MKRVWLQEVQRLRKYCPNKHLIDLNLCCDFDLERINPISSQVTPAYDERCTIKLSLFATGQRTKPGLHVKRTDGQAIPMYPTPFV